MAEADRRGPSPVVACGPGTEDEKGHFGILWRKSCVGRPMEQL